VTYEEEQDLYLRRLNMGWFTSKKKREAELEQQRRRELDRYRRRVDFDTGLDSYVPSSWSSSCDSSSSSSDGGGCGGGE
jgi:hypothetical protein